MSETHQSKRARTLSYGEAVRIESIDYKDLSDDSSDSSKKLLQTIENAFGKDGLGIIAITNVPKVKEMREKLLPLGRKFAMLPDEIKAKYEHPYSLWSFGWSHGKEKLQGRPDFAKGSYYANPLENVPFEDEAIVKEWPTFAHPNIWPEEDMPELEPAFMKLGKLVVDVGMLVGKLCDEFVSKHTKDEKIITLLETIRKSKVTKARLLHYFSKTKKQLELERESPRKGEDMFSSWCGWHNDHGSLTGLVPAIYFDDKSDQRLSCSPDPDAGLYIRSRRGRLVKATTPPGTSLLYQIGETAQILSGGIMQATPHAVRGAGIPNISRTTFAVFMEPNFDEFMRAPKDRLPGDAQTTESASKLPSGVPPIKIRWGTKECPFTTCNFGTFTKETLKHYH